jgi:hypothetical protein
VGIGSSAVSPVGPIAIDSFEDKLELRANGQAIAILPARDRRTILRRDMTTVPIDGIDPARSASPPAQATTTASSDFRDAARTHLTPSAPILDFKRLRFALL